MAYRHSWMLILFVIFNSLQVNLVASLPGTLQCCRPKGSCAGASVHTVTSHGWRVGKTGCCILSVGSVAGILNLAVTQRGNTCRIYSPFVNSRVTTKAHSSWSGCVDPLQLVTCGPWAPACATPAAGSVSQIHGGVKCRAMLQQPCLSLMLSVSVFFLTENEQTSPKSSSVQLRLVL